MGRAYLADELGHSLFSAIAPFDCSSAIHVWCWGVFGCRPSCLELSCTLRHFGVASLQFQNPSEELSSHSFLNYSHYVQSACTVPWHFGHCNRSLLFLLFLILPYLLIKKNFIKRSRISPPSFSPTHITLKVQPTSIKTFLSCINCSAILRIHLEFLSSSPPIQPSPPSFILLFSCFTYMFNLCCVS